MWRKSRSASSRSAEDLAGLGPEVEAQVTEVQARARKIQPEYTSGELVRVAGARNQAEAELIQNLLLEEGIPSLLRRSPGFDVPDFLAGGPRDVMVPESGAEAAGDLLRAAELGPNAGGASLRPVRPLRLLVATSAAGLLAAAIAWALVELAAG